MLNYLDQVWTRAAETVEPRAPIKAATFDRVARQMFPFEVRVLFDYRLKLGHQFITIPYQDVTNYLGTVEPIRLLQTLTTQTRERDPARAPLTADAIASACQLAALLSTAVLKEANTAARENRHRSIQDEDVLAADSKISGELMLASYDPAQNSTSTPQAFSSSSRSTW